MSAAEKLVPWVVGPLAIAALLFILSGGGCSSDAADSAAAKAYAYSAMQTFVKRRLKAPSTAEFPSGGQSQHVEHIGNEQYRIESYVDAQNEFGAMRRLSFAGVVEKTGDDRYELNSFAMGSP